MDLEEFIKQVKDNPAARTALEIIAKNGEVISLLVNGNSAVEKHLLRLMIELAAAAYSAGVDDMTNAFERIFNEKRPTPSEDTPNEKEVSLPRETTEIGVESCVAEATPWSFGPVPEIWEDPVVHPSRGDATVDHEQGSSPSEEPTLPGDSQ